LPKFRDNIGTIFKGLAVKEDAQNPWRTNYLKSILLKRPMLHVPNVLKSGSLNLQEPSGPVQTCTELALPLPLSKNHYNFPSTLYGLIKFFFSQISTKLLLYYFTGNITQDCNRFLTLV